MKHFFLKVLKSSFSSKLKIIIRNDQSPYLFLKMSPFVFILIDKVRLSL